MARIDDRVFALLPLGRGTGGEPGSVAVGTLTGDLYFVDASARRPPRRWRYHTDGSFALLQLPGPTGGGDVLVGGGRGRLSRWRADGSAMITAIELCAGVRIRSLAFLRRPGLIAAGTGAGDVHLLAPRSLRAVHVIERAHELTVFSIADAGDRFYTAGRDGKLRAWSGAAPFAQLLHVDAHAATVNAVAIREDGGPIATVGRDREVRLWREEPGGLVLAKALIAGRDGGHAASVNAGSWLAGGLATAGDDRTIRYWPTRAE